MTAKTDDKKSAADLVSRYRPLGLKAVLAAALQVKADAPAPKKTSRNILERNGPSCVAFPNIRRAFGRLSPHPAPIFCKSRVRWIATAAVALCQ